MSVSDMDGMISSGPELDEVDAPIESALRVRVRVVSLRPELEDNCISRGLVASCGAFPR